MPDQQGRAERAARIARRGLHPDFVERPFAQNPTVADAVERDTAREAEIAQTSELMCVAGHSQHDLLGHSLERARKVHVPLRQFRFGPARPSAEEPIELAVRHSQTRDEIEVVEVKMKRTVRLKIDKLIENELFEFWFAVGRQSHHFVFAGVDPEPEIISERRIEQAERMWKMLLGQHLDTITRAAANAGGGPFTDAVNCQNRSLVKRRWKKRGRSVRLMMLREQNVAFVIELVADDLFDPHFALDPERHRFEKRSQPAGRTGEISREEAFAFQERFFVKRDKIDISRRDQPAQRDTGADGVDRELSVMFLAGEPFLLCRSNDFFIAHKARGAVVIKRGDAENVHRLSYFALAASNACHAIHARSQFCLAAQHSASSK